MNGFIVAVCTDPNPTMNEFIMQQICKPPTWQRMWKLIVHENDWISETTGVPAYWYQNLCWLSCWEILLFYEYIHGILIEKERWTWGVQTTELSHHDSDLSGSGQARAREHKQGYNIGRKWKRIDRSPKEMGKLELGWVGARNCVIVRGSSGSAERLNLSCCGSIFPTDG